jgi:hypothetical protein
MCGSGAGVMFLRAQSDRKPEGHAVAAMPSPFYSYDRSSPGYHEFNSNNPGGMFDSASELGEFHICPKVRLYRAMLVRK